MLQACVVFTFKLPQVFEDYKSIILLSCADYFCLLLSLLTGVICFRLTPFFDLLIRVYKGTVGVFLHNERQCIKRNFKYS